MTGYELSRCFYDWAFENRTVFKPTVSALYFYLVEVCNRLGWKKEFSISAKECMEGMGVSGYNTYKGAFDVLCANGFVTVVKKSCNHHQANIITLSNFNKVNSTVSNEVADNVPSEQSERSGDIHKTIKPTKPKTDKDKSLNVDFVDVDFLPIVNDWIEYKKSRGERYKSAQSLKALYKKMLKISGDDSEIARKVIDESMANNWAGIFPLRTEKEKSCAKKENESKAPVNRNYDDDFNAKPKVADDYSQRF